MMSTKMILWVSFLLCLVTMTISVMCVYDLQYTEEKMVYGRSRIVARATGSAFKPCLAICLIVSTPGLLPAVRWVDQISNENRGNFVTKVRKCWQMIRHSRLINRVASLWPSQSSYGVSNTAFSTKNDHNAGWKCLAQNTLLAQFELIWGLKLSRCSS